MVLEKARLTLPEREVRWQALADARLSLFGPDALIVPMAWQTHDTGTVVKTIGGQQVDFTYSQSQSVFDFDTPPSYLGPTGIPIINFNGSDEHLSSPNAAFWNDTAGSSEPSYYFSCWINLVLSTHAQSILTKTNDVGTGITDWAFHINSSERAHLHIGDDSENAFIGRRTGTLSAGWHHLAVTKDDDSADDASMLFYDNGTVVGTVSGSPTYVQQEDGTVAVNIGRTDGEGNRLLSPLAGGPLGPMFIAVGANAVPTPDAIKRDYQLGRAALGI